MMLIIGYKNEVKVQEAIRSLNKHTNLNLKESKIFVEDVLQGQVKRLDEDFVLREELEDNGFTFG